MLEIKEVNSAVNHAAEEDAEEEHTAEAKEAKTEICLESLKVAPEPGQPVCPAFSSGPLGPR